MENLDKLKETFPAAAKDIKINLGNVLGAGHLAEAQVWGVAIACAYASRNQHLTDAVLADARAKNIPDGTIEDARAAAVLMGMNNVLYRFKHIIDKQDYAQKPARLRMQRLAQVTSTKADFELFCLAVSAINNCETCIRAHEATVIEQGLSTDQVIDAVRIASTIQAAAIAVEAR